MAENIVKLEIQIEDRFYVFFCDPQSPLGHVKEALFQLTKRVGQIEDKIIEAQKESISAIEEK